MDFILIWWVDNKLVLSIKVYGEVLVIEKSLFFFFKKVWWIGKMEEDGDILDEILDWLIW